MTIRLGFYERQDSVASDGDDDSSCSSLELEHECFRKPVPAAHDQEASRPTGRGLGKIFKGLSARNLGLSFTGSSSRSIWSDESLSVRTDTAGSVSTIDADNKSLDCIDHEHHSSSQLKAVPSSIDLKVTGTTMMRTDDNTAYAQLILVPQDTVVLVRRAPVPRRQRSVRRIVHSHVNDLMPEEDDVLSVGSPLSHARLTRHSELTQSLHRSQPSVARRRCSQRQLSM